MIDFNRHSDSYEHWHLTLDGPVATLALQVDPDHSFGGGYDLKLNSYDLGVDMCLGISFRQQHRERRSC